MLKKLNFAEFVSKGYSFQEEVLWRVKRAGGKFAETPITFVDRVHGQSKINMHEARKAVLILGRLGIKNWIGI